MEFWGAEVKVGEPLKVEPGRDRILHLSQASLGEVKKDKGNESIVLFVKVGGEKLVLGTLSPEKCPQISYDLVFEKGFELSHNWKNGSVYFCGYRSVVEEEPNDFTDSDSGEDLPLNAIENGKPEPDAAAKPGSSATKQKMKMVELDKAGKSKAYGNDDDDEDEDDSEEDESDDEDMHGAEDGSDEEDDDDESSDEEDEPTPPMKAEQLKKRPAESATKTPAPEKKAKLVTPLKTGGDGKKGAVHIDTPYPKKNPANNDKAKQQSPKSTGQIQCKSCSRKFNSDSAVEAHTKAKHSGGN